MKLRISENSLRLRLSNLEVERLMQLGRLEEILQFKVNPKSELKYILEVSQQISRIEVELSFPTITFQLPHTLFLNWAQTPNLITLEETSIDPPYLKIYIEKDLKSS